MKMLNKKDILYIGIIILAFLGIVFITSGTTFLYGSNLDWISQHVTFPEYFRTLFYEAHEFFPDFALNIGGGQNIYNFAYYGLFNPLLWLSYIMPKVPMAQYITTMSIGTVIADIILIYTFLRNKKYSSEICLLSTICLATATCLNMHSHRHIMFINYMPFLLLGLFGVDKKLDDNKGWLLSLSVFLMILTSYYYSIAGIFVLVIYGIYKYLIKTKKVTVQSFFKVGIPFLMPIIVGILASSILIIPTMAAILNSREATGIAIPYKDILLPNMNLNYIFYDNYGVGLSAIVIPAIIDFYKNKKEHIFMGLCLTLPVIFPLINYIMNGTMYISSKILIPLMPLYILVIAEFLKNLLNDKVDIKRVFFYTALALIFFTIGKMADDKRYCLGAAFNVVVLFASILLMRKYKNKYLFIVPLIITSFVCSITSGLMDQLVLKKTYKNNYHEMKEIINYVTTKDNSFYRISNFENIADNPNRIYGDIDYYTSTVYSSLSNQDYNHFYFDIMDNHITHRNRALTTSTTNELFLLLTNNKYIVGRTKPLYGYKQIYEKNGIKVYRNNNTLPFGFASSNTMSLEDFNKLTSFQKQEALLYNIITDSKSYNNHVSYIQNIEFDDSVLLKQKYIKKNADNSYTIKVNDTTKFNIDLPEQYQNKIIFISFNMNMNQSCEIGDQAIKINNSKNKLTCREWIYYNNNNVFSYAISEENLTKLTISINKGMYNISDIKVAYLDPATLENINKKVDKFLVDTNSTKGDYISGSIDVTKNGYFMLTVPYDEGFHILLDGKPIDYEKVDEAFIGFPIQKGHHEIFIEYEAPLKGISLLLTQIGIVLFCIITYLESKRKI